MALAMVLIVIAAGILRLVRLVTWPIRALRSFLQGPEG